MTISALIFVSITLSLSRIWYFKQYFISYILFFQIVTLIIILYNIVRHAWSVCFLFGLLYCSKSNKMPGCAAVGCSNSSAKGFLMKHFPKDLAKKEMWLFQMRRNNWIPTKYSCLCEVSKLSTYIYIIYILFNKNCFVFYLFF